LLLSRKISTTARYVRATGSPSPSTIRRDLKKSGAVSRKRQRGPKRLSQDPGRRVERCKAYLRLGAKLKNVIVSDEKYFDSQDHGSTREWCFDGETPRRTVRETWCPRVHVWGVIGLNFKILVRIPAGRQNASAYKRLCLIPLCAEWARIGRLQTAIFQFDGDSSHDAGTVLRYLDNKEVQILPDWPPRSPDLSPIENMWAIVQHHVDREVAPEASEDEIWEHVQRVWDDIPMSKVNNLVGSLPRRFRECVRVNGATIRTKGAGVKRSRSSA